MPGERREVEDSRLESHAWPLDSAVEEVMVRPVWMNHGVEVLVLALSEAGEVVRVLVLCLEALVAVAVESG